MQDNEREVIAELLLCSSAFKVAIASVALFSDTPSAEIDLNVVVLA
jgi:hypothetical protein